MADLDTDQEITEMDFKPTPYFEDFIFEIVEVVNPDGPVQTKVSTTESASINIPHGAAPTSPVNGDVWTTTAGLFVQINGVTVGPLT